MYLPIRVLILERSDSEEETLRAALRQAGFSPETDGVRTERDFVARLDPGFDLILAGADSPGFGALRALEKLRETGWDIPLIAVSDSPAEEEAARLLEAGAAHCLSRDRLRLLGPAARQALEQRRFRSESRRALDALRQSESRYRTLVENARDVVFHLDAEGRITLLNRVFEEITGWDRDEWVDRPFAPLIHEEDRARAIDIFRRTLDGERIDIYELRIAHREGGHLVGEFIITRQQDNRGNRSVLGIARDVTQRKQTAEALKRSEERLRHILENTSDCLWEIDENAVYTYVSPRIRHLLGYEPAEVIGKRPFDLMPDEEARRLLRHFNDLLAKREGFSLLENTNLHKDGHKMVLESSGVPVFDREGVFRGYRGIDRDITERKRLEAQIRQSQKMESLGALAGGIAHDFNNLIGIVSGYCEIALESLGADHPAREFMTQIDAAAGRASDLVQQILTFARKTPVSVAPLDLNELVLEIVRMIRETFPRTVEIACSLADKPPPVAADASQINQVLMNLCVNARDAMPQGGRLMLITRLVESERFPRAAASTDRRRFVCLSVSDTGSGIPEEIRQSIFDPFFTTKVTARRTGLGLSVVHGIVEGHGGCIEVETEADCGTIFHVYLPASEEKTEPTPGTEEVSSSREGSETVLLVEDEPAIRKMTRTALESRGYRVLTAHDGAEALDRYREHREEIAVVLLDLGLPKKDGLSVLEEIKAIDTGATVILASGFLDSEQQQRLDRAGGAEFVAKPYELRRLLKTVEEAVEGRSGGCS